MKEPLPCQYNGMMVTEDEAGMVLQPFIDWPVTWKAIDSNGVLTVYSSLARLLARACLGCEKSLRVIAIFESGKEIEVPSRILERWVGNGKN